MKKVNKTKQKSQKTNTLPEIFKVLLILFVGYNYVLQAIYGTKALLNTEMTWSNPLDQAMVYFSLVILPLIVFAIAFISSSKKLNNLNKVYQSVMLLIIGFFSSIAVSMLFTLFASMSVFSTEANYWNVFSTVSLIAIYALLLIKYRNWNKN